MSKKAKLTIILVTCFVVVLAIIVLATSLTVGNANYRFIKQMTKLNYNVIDYTPTYHEYNAYDKSYYMTIEAARQKGKSYDFVEMYIFKNKDDATKFYGEETAELEEGIYVIQKGKRVYRGTKPGINDLGI